MRRHPFILVTLVAWPWIAAAGELSGSVTLASEYIFRGQALSDGNPAVQVGIDYEHEAGLFFGAWASTADISSLSGRRDAELDYYLGWQFSGESRLSAALSLVHYTYPGQTTDIDYDYTELLATASWDGRYSLEFGYTDDVYGFGVGAHHVELRAEWPLRNAWVISAGLGANDLDELGSSRYLYGDLGVSARFARLTVDLRWYDNEKPAGYAGRLSAGSQLVGALSVGF